tara:strand:- start:3138 stop:4409 length:1272 start_codon:yes stop_codon:yes gene_type:complete
MTNNHISPLKGRKILVAATGSIAAVKTPLLVSELIQAGAEVRCVVTPSASKLVSPLALSTLSRKSCYLDKDQWDHKQSKPLHIELAEWAEIIVIAPLSANSLAKWVHGIGEGLLASLLLAYEKPVIAAAAMNTGMWSNYAVKKNWEALSKNNQVIPLNPSFGLLACDRIGEGKMVNTEIIRLALESALIRKNAKSIISNDWKDLHLLVTAGATVEDLDPARQISNKSSGRMGVLIAQAAKLRGAKIDLIHGSLDIPSDLTEGLNNFPVRNSEEMQIQLEKLQKTADVIAMAAAVSDFRRKGGKAKQKIQKDYLINSLDLEIVPDLLSEVSSRKKEKQIILGFAALTGNDEQIQSLGEIKRGQKGCDLLMANPIDRSHQGFGVNFNGGFLLSNNKKIKTMPVISKFELANQLLDEILLLKSEVF